MASETDKPAHSSAPHEAHRSLVDVMRDDVEHDWPEDAARDALPADGAEPQAADTTRAVDVSHEAASQSPPQETQALLEPRAESGDQKSFESVGEGAATHTIAPPRAPVWLAGGVGGILGALAATALHAIVPAKPVSDPQVTVALAALDKRLGAADAALGEVDKKVAGVSVALAAANKTAATLQGAVSEAGVRATAAQDRADDRAKAVESALAVLRADLKAETQRRLDMPAAAPGMVSGEITTTPAAPIPVPAAAQPVDLAPLEARLADLEAQTKAQAAQQVAQQAAREAAAQAEAAKSEAAKTTERVAVAQSAALSMERDNAAALAVTAQALAQAVATGAGFADALAAAASLGAPAGDIAKLQAFADADLPAPAALAAQFDVAVDAALKLAAPSPAVKAPAGWFDRLFGSSGQLVRVTPPPSAEERAARAAAGVVREALAQGDAAAALAGAEKLPAQLREGAAQALLDKARSKLAAEAAAKSILAAALANLRKPKS